MRVGSSPTALRRSSRRNRASSRPISEGGILLEIENLTVSYGRNEAVRSISFAVPAASIIALVGANGAGKTSTLNAITGLVPSRGRITKNGKTLSGLSTDDIVRLGVAQVAEGRQLFPLLSVRENLEL